MKLNLKSFFAGVLVTSLVGAGTVAFAESSQTIQAIFGRVKLVVADKPVAQETLLYNGTTYVPLRAAAEILGKEVAWDGATNTAYIDEKGKGRTFAAEAAKVPETEKVQVETAQRAPVYKSAAELQAYINDTYSVVKTSLGDCVLQTLVAENNDQKYPFDYEVYVTYDVEFMNYVISDKKLTTEQRRAVKEEMKSYMSTLATDVVNKMPGQKIIGQYSYMYYKYPNLKMDLVVFSDYEWSNFGTAVSARYSATTATDTITWFDIMDNYFQ